ncbi:MAG TPA: phosphoribosylamine--glycine ligase [Acidobacteriaceae bacterium]
MSGIKALLIGGGGREHALAWAIARSNRIAEVVCAPGNGGMEQLARCVHASQKDLGDLLRVVVAEQPDLTIVGPEVPLALGLVDELQRRSLPVFGPTRAAAALETSKSFAKRFMQRHSIPTGNYAVCLTQAEALQSLELFHLPLVIKADGLQGGKGVLICETRREAQEAIAGLFSGRLLGSAETSVVVEEFLKGEEISFLVLSDGKHVTALVPAQDHKRIGEGDTGLNTGGMGAYSTDQMLAPEMRAWILHHIAQPTINGMAAEETPFVGVLFIGLMMTARGPMVLEFNTRFGDPETQAIVVRLKSDLLEGLQACVEGRLSDTEFRWRPGASACVIAAASGYPGSYLSGARITGVAAAAAVPGVQVFHAGTTRDSATGDYLTAGGRVLGVSAVAPNLGAALEIAYGSLAKIHYEGMYYRRDIGHRAITA